jgi:hypothetical protein
VKAASMRRSVLGPREGVVVAAESTVAVAGAVAGSAKS